MFGNFYLKIIIYLKAVAQKNMSEVMSIVKFSSWATRLFKSKMTKQQKKIIEASALLCLLLAMALILVRILPKQLDYDLQISLSQWW